MFLSNLTTHPNINKLQYFSYFQLDLIILLLVDAGLLQSLPILDSIITMLDGVIPGYSTEEKVNTLISYQEMAFQAGVTMCHDAMLDRSERIGHHAF